MGKNIRITETVLRDANQSLMATRLPYSDFEDILETMDKAGYYSVAASAEPCTSALTMMFKVFISPA